MLPSGTCLQTVRRLLTDCLGSATHQGEAMVIEKQLFIHNLMVRIHLIIVMILVDRPCAMGV